METMEFITKLHDHFPEFGFVSIRPAEYEEDDDLIIVHSVQTNCFLLSFNYSPKSELVFGLRYGQIDFDRLQRLMSVINKVLED